MTTFVQAVPFEVAGAKATVKQAVPAGGVVHRRTPNSLRIPGPQVSSGAGQVLLSSGLLVAAATARPGRRRKLVRQAEAATATSTQTLSETQTKFWEMLQLDLEDVVYPEFGEDNLGRVKQFIKHCTYEEPVPKLPDMQEADPEYFPGLTSSPWWDTAECGEWIEKVKEGLPYVQGELADLLEDNEESMVSDSVKNDVMGGGWSGFRLQRLGDWISKNCDLFPQTVQLLKDAKAPLAMRGVIIARQGPNTGVNSHSDGRNFFLTAHFGLCVPDGCDVTVGGETRSWEEDGAIVFDTSYMHSTRNTSEEDRFVLIVDFWHPDLTYEEREALEYIYDFRTKWEQGKIQYVKQMPKDFWKAFEMLAPWGDAYTEEAGGKSSPTAADNSIGGISF